MPAVAMLHEKDPKQALIDKIGSVEEVELFHTQVLVAVYIRPEQTRGGIILTEQNRDEDKHQGKLGLILKTGPAAFQGDDKWSWPEGVGVGDWVFFRASDGWAMTVNGHRDNLCRVLADVDIKGRIQHPDQVW